MIGKPKRREPKLFYQFDLDAMVPRDHLLRRIDQAVDFSFARREVASLYGDRGNESVDPAVTLRLVLLLFLENVPSQRALMRQLPLRLDWLWFCGFDIDEADQLPDHSVLTKARKLWGRETFLRLFERVVGACVQAGLVDGSTIYADASVNAANASMDSLRTHLRVRGGQMYDALEREESQPVGAATPPASPAPEMPAADPLQPAAAPQPDPEPDPMLGKPLSTTDPEARLTRKHGQTILGYKDHRVIDDRCGIITATLTTPADVDDGSMLMQSVEEHERVSGGQTATVVADKGYGHADNYRQLHERGLSSCIPHKQVREDPTKFRRSLFVFDQASNTYTCPAGQTLTARGGRYRAGPGVCRNCPLRSRCTDNKVHGRQLRRHPLQEEIDRADRTFSREHRRRLLARRKTLVEGRFADAANHHGYKRLRWRGLEGATIQHLLIATAQNLRKLARVLCRARRPRRRLRASGSIRRPVPRRLFAVRRELFRLPARSRV